MAISSKDIETLWNRYSEEGCENGASVAQYFESNGVPDMEREQYQNRIKDLLQAVETLLNSNRVIGEENQRLKDVEAKYADL